MKTAQSDKKGSNLPAPNNLRGKRFCRSCGTTKDMGRRKYCSRQCRQRLVWRLEVASNLLRALHARYATFSFTQEVLMLNVASFGADEVFSFLWRRTPGRKPSEDLGDLTEHLGRLWWRELEDRNCRRSASLFVLESAHTQLASDDNIRPLSYLSPKVSARNLSVLKLTKNELMGESAPDLVKSAYRKQVFIHHPDKDGDAKQFRRVQEAYEELQDWLEHPILKSKKGLPDKWSFNGEKWSPPVTIGFL